MGEKERKKKKPGGEKKKTTYHWDIYINRSNPGFKLGVNDSVE